MSDPNRCCKTVFGDRDVRGHQCLNKWKVERDGKRYCKTHDPEKVKERNQIRKKRWDEKTARYVAKLNAEAIGRVLIAAGYDTEEKARGLLARIAELEAKP